ncbi:MAG: hypothetical protein R3F61_09065 [Myxococcota bacterium]
MVWWLLAACAPSVGSSTPSPPTPGASVPLVSDPRAYVRDAFIQHPATWSGTADFNLTDPAVIDPIIDKAVKTRRRNWNGELPHDADELDAFIRISKGMYATGILDTPELRARVEAKVAERFANPPVSRNGDTVTVDLGWAPGVLEKLTRAGWGIGSSEHVEKLELRRDDVLRAFGVGATAHPDARIYVVTVVLPRGTRSQHFEYRYDTREGRLRVVESHNTIHLTKTRANSIQEVVAGALPTHTSEMVTSTEEAGDYELR